MGNIVLSTCVGYGPDSVEPFIRTCRKAFEGEIHVIAADVPAETVELLERHHAHVHQRGLEFSKHTRINEARYPIYRALIERLEFERAFICDIRDVFFQSDPFSFGEAKPALKFFAEDSLVGNCEVNRAWVLHCYGANALKNMASNVICCTGTVMGSRGGVMDYVHAMEEEIGRTAVYQGSDQVRLNYLIDKRRFPNAVVQENRTGEVQTMHHQKVLSFSREGLLLNVDGRVCPVIHQYDRHPRFASSFGALRTEWLPT
jgi:hypothetical protein